LATQQAALNKTAAEDQTRANRVNQYNAYGSQTWSTGADGRDVQTTTYNPEYQRLLDTQRSYDQNLMDTAGGMLSGIRDATGQPIDFSGLTQPREWQGTDLPDMSNLQDWGSIDFSDNPELADAGFGAVESVRDAMMSRLQPGLQRGADQEIARLKSMGITEGSPQMQAALEQQGHRMNDAEQQALLGAAGEYGNIFNRSLQARQQSVGEEMATAEYANSLRGQQYGEGKDRWAMSNQNEVLARTADEDDYSRQLREMLMKRQLPLSEYQQLMGTTSGAPNLSFPGYANAASGGAMDVYGAAGDQYAASMGGYNAIQARKAGAIGALGSIAGSFFGPAGTMVGGAAGNAVGNKAAPQYQAYPAPAYRA
jgi:hypothetical protein